VVVAALLSTVGCAAIQRSEAIDTERQLAASGFQMKLADTPALMQQAESLPQMKLVPIKHQGQTRFVYADTTNCKCIYVGTQQAYDRLQKLKINTRLAQEQVDAEMDMDSWGTWGPWY
jgi:hypothetical protein